MRSTTIWQLYIDGASKGNPGLSGAGFCLYKNDEHMQSKGFVLQTCTNNQAEYMGLLIGLFFSQDYFQKNDTLIIMSDSQLLVEQMNGRYKINNHILRQFCFAARSILLHLGIAHHINHILRSYNTQADAMANYGIANNIALTPDFFIFLQRYHLHV